MSTPRLWSWNLSPFAGKVRVALAEKGVAIELLEIDARNRPARLRELNPVGRVPVLEVGAVAINESTAICEWLQETHPEHPLWPEDPDRRAVARGVLRFVDDELTTNFFLSLRKQAFGLDETDHAEVVETLQRRLVTRWPIVERRLAGSDGSWLLPGEAPTLADLAAIPLAVRLPQWRADLQPSQAEQPLTVAWLERLRSRPSGAEVDRRGAPVEA